jgi:hypothetical protein
MSDIADIKGTVQRRDFDFRFFIKRLILVPIDTPKSDFGFCRIFVELFVFEIPRNRLPAIIDSGESKIEP